MFAQRRIPMLQRAIAAFIALAGLSTASGAQIQAWAQAPDCAMPSIADTVVLEDVPDSNLRTVPVVINGTRKQFLLDVGTNLTEVSEAAVSQLGLPDVRNAPSDYMNLYPGVDTGKEQTGKANFDMNVTVSAAFFNVKGASSAENYRAPCADRHLRHRRGHRPQSDLRGGQGRRDGKGEGQTL
jgi:hypothetical protein